MGADGFREFGVRNQRGEFTFRSVSSSISGKHSTTRERAFMDTMRMIEERHSVRKYLDKAIDPATLGQLEAEIARVNAESGLHIQYAAAKDGACGSLALRLVGWRNAQGCLVLAGPNSATLEEDCGYWGEHLVLFAQSLGLNSCWAGMAREKNVGVELAPGDSYVIAVGLGYGANQGKPHKSKPFDQVARMADGTPATEESAPAWFVRGVQSALLAPTAVNQQKFTFTLEADGSASAHAPEGNLTKVDLGIAKYHFEAATGVKARTRQ